MKRNDLRAMGLTPDQIDTIMTMNGMDINREKAKAGQQTDKEVQRLRESCITLLELLGDPGSRARHPAARFPPVL